LVSLITQEPNLCQGAQKIETAERGERPPASEILEALSVGNTQLLVTKKHSPVSSPKKNPPGTP